MTRIRQIGSGGATVSVSERGARVAQVRTRAGGDWFLESREPERAGGAPRFDRGARAGWDDCFPSIEPAAPDAPWPGASLADDHGALWHRRWDVVEAGPARLRLQLADDGLPIRAEREIAVDGASVSTVLTVENRGTTAIPFLYSAHPMFAWRGDAELRVPGGADVRWAFGDGVAWAGEAGGLRLSIPLDGRRGCLKYFVRWAGEATLASGGTTLRVRADPAELGWLGVCVNRLGWPEPECDQSWIALEPCTAPTDALGAAIGRGDDGSLEPGESRRFGLDVTEI